MRFSTSLTSPNSITATSPSSPSSPTSQSTISTLTVSPTSDCSNGSTYQSLFQNGLSSAGLNFTKLCSTEFSTLNTGSAYVYTFEDCIEVCAGLNFYNGDRNCVGVTYYAIGTRPANCWAHNMSSFYPRTNVDAAVLQA
jgi:hypothetical protein